MEFEDGTVSEYRKYMQFKRGDIRNPNVPHGLSKGHARVGERFPQNSSLEAEITPYRSAADCIVRFSNGEVSEGVICGKLKAGSVQPPSMQNKKRASKPPADRRKDCGG